MGIRNRKEPILLLIGDIFFLVVSLYLTLALRYLDFPAGQIWQSHIEPFSILFIVWVIAFYIAGLYEKHTLILKNNLPTLLFNTQIINSVVAVLFFYFIPYFGITPKTNLFIYLVISLALILFWRLKIYPSFHIGKVKQDAILIGRSNEMKELLEEVNNNDRYDFKFHLSIDLDRYDIGDYGTEVAQTIYEKDISLVVADINDEKVEKIVSQLYNLIFAKVQFLDKNKVYESIFDRIPLSIMSHNWFLENISSNSHVSYDVFKRAMDFVISLILGSISLILYPFVFLAIKIDDKGKIFFIDERIGEDNKKIKIYKFRSMRVQDGGEAAISKTGRFLRNSRIDELPQLWNVLKGDLSLIGPRPEKTELVETYREQVPFYNVRHLIKPGLSGWAQMKHDEHPHHGVDADATRDKLSYDLYYLKNRSLLLDFKIALQTVKVLFSRSGR